MLSKLIHAIRRTFNVFGYDIRKQKKEFFSLLTPKNLCVTEFVHSDVLYKFFIENPNDAIQKEHLSERLYEEEELSIIKSYFPYNGTFVDIGANVGNHSIFACLALGASKVIAFEPALLQHTIFSVNIALNALQEKIDLHKVAISSTTGVSRLLTPLPDNIGRAYLNKYSQGEFVQLYPADYFLGDEYNISFIKIDVEGHEIDVLQGLESTIKRCSPTIFIEVDNSNAQRFHDWLSELGYTIVDRFKRYESNENFVIKHKNKS